MSSLGRNMLFAVFLLALVLPTANAGFVEIYLDNSEDLVLRESSVPPVIEQGTDFKLKFHVSGPLCTECEDKNESKTVVEIYLDVVFLNEENPRDTCEMCAIPQPVEDDIYDYDVYQANFYGDSATFKDYSGGLQFSIIMKNREGGKVYDNVIEVTMTSPSSTETESAEFALPELPPVIADNLVVIIGGLFALIILSVLIYTFVLAPEDTTDDLFQEKEAVNPLSKSLTGVGYDSDLPGENEEEEDEEELIDDDEEEEPFDESKLLAELTGSQKLSSEGDKEVNEAQETAETKKTVKKKVVRKSVAKKVVRKATPTQKEAPAQKEAPTKTVTQTKPEVNMGEGIVSVTCPACEKIHNVNDDVSKFICSCGRRIRL